MLAQVIIVKKNARSQPHCTEAGCLVYTTTDPAGETEENCFRTIHAEINAIDDCRTLSIKPEGATMYVTLEPCCHHGKTGPCTEAILDAKLARVVIATPDPCEHANGKGIEQLRQAGIEVEVGLCEEEARRINAPFFKYATTGKCWVVLKWAQSLDGKLAYAEQNEQQRWISNELSRKDAHKLRRRVGAVLVGINTVLADDPMLTPRPSQGKKPLRVVLDNGLRVPLKSRLLRTVKTCPVLVYTREVAAGANAKHAERIAKRGAEVLAYGEKPGTSNLHFLLEQLSRRGVQQVLVEGGPKVLTSFLKEGLADEICVYIAPKILAAEGAVYVGEPMAELSSGIGLEHVEVKVFAEDVRINGRLTSRSATFL